MSFFNDTEKIDHKTIMEHDYPYNYEKGILWADEVQLHENKHVDKNQHKNITFTPSKNKNSKDRYSYKNRFDILSNQSF